MLKKTVRYTLLVMAGALTAAQAAPYLMPTGFNATRDYVTLEAAHSGEIFFMPLMALKGAGFYAIDPAGLRTKLDSVIALKDLSMIEAPVSAKGTYRFTTGDDNARTMKYALIDGSWLMVRSSGQRPGGEGAKPGGEGKPTGEGKPRGQEGERPRFVEELALPAGAKVIETKMIGKAETYVTKGAPSDAATKPSGQGFELRPITHPNDIYVDQGFEFELLEDGKPLPDVKVQIVRNGNLYDDKRSSADIQTDAHGRAKAGFDRPGVYALTCSYPAQQHDRAVQPPARSYSYTLTFEVTR